MIHIIELRVNEEIQELDISKFTQEIDNLDRMNWQTPYDEKFFNADNEIIGDWVDVPATLEPGTKIIFFFHELNFNKPLTTPFGEFEILHAVDQPNWMKEIIIYEAP